MKLYAIKDCKVGSFLSVLTFANDAEAKRYLDYLVNSSTELIHLYPEDFQLFSLGSYDNVSGVITSDVSFLVNAVEYRR